ncbi:glycosyltransferase family 2 protein [Cerasicoccus fimbriatus]|uniref:glycosyltransferase family 2 protein n=1 Tax=Cerasicoccus fimbriatus TaxID=3014554 RepID=UPI0022B37ADE|nr:glycosyltransferase family 2 protein [Cerasicoccus sp. TK19100]
MDRPASRVSIIIPVYNSLELTRKCVDSLLATSSDDLPLEVILVDDLSTDGAREYVASLKDRPGFKVILRSEKGSFAINNNQAAREASAPLLCLINNDVELTPGWLAPMVSLMESQPQAGLVGNVQVNPATGLVDHAGMVCWPDGSIRQARKNRLHAPREAWLEWSCVTAACVLVKREVFLSVGGFDEAYRNGSEDADLAVRLKLAGYRHFVANESVITHHVSSAPGRGNHVSANESRLREQWGTQIAEWAQVEWPGEYFQRYARHWWKLHPGLVLKAVAWRMKYGRWQRATGPRIKGA